MKIKMAGIDYSLASLEQREQFALTQSRQKEVLSLLKNQPGVAGAVLLCTCNRTELYLSCQEDLDPDPFLLLCRQLGIQPERVESLFRRRQGEEVFWHLGRLACGAKSQIWGEDQIISQVKNALTLAREEKAADSILEVLFRTGITAAKKIKTEIVFARGESSIAARTLALLLEQRPLPRKVLVIGNGEVGRLTAETLIQGGFSVGMTLRQYKYSQVQLPEGVLGLDYSQRYAHLPEFDAVVSATLSPHYTIEAGPFSQLESPPRLLVDLAVPRDLDPALGAVPGVRLWDIDQLAAGKVQQEHSRQMEQIDGILSKYLEDFRHWNSYRERAMVCKNVM